MLLEVKTMYELIQRFLGEGGDFFVFVAVGMVVVVFHARSRLKLVAPMGDNYDFVRLLSLPTLVGRYNFRLSIFIYTILLEVFYIFICLSKPLFPDIIGNTPDYDGASWPLGAALVVVGILPATPVIDQIELGLRRFALSAADIPGEFFRRVNGLSQKEVRRGLERDPQHRHELKRYWKIYNLSLFSGCTKPEATELARRGIGLSLFTKWTVNDTSIWSDTERDKLAEVFDLVRPKAEKLTADLNDLIKDTESSAIVQLIAKRFRVTASGEISDETAQAIQEFSVIELLDELSPEERAKYPPDLFNDLTLKADTWRALIKDLANCNRRMSAVFATLAINDIETTNKVIKKGTGENTTILSNMLIALRRVSVKPNSPAYNSVIIACASAFVFTFLVFFAYKTLYPSNSAQAGAFSISETASNVSKAISSLRIENSTQSVPEKISLVSQELSAAIRRAPPRKATPFEFSLFKSTTLFLSLLSASITSLFIRKSRVEAGKWISTRTLLQLPMIQFSGMTPLICAATFIPYMASVILYAFYMENIDDLKELAGLASVGFVSFSMAWTLVPAVFALGICVVTDFIEQGQNNIKTFAAIAWVSFFVMFASFMLIKAFARSFPSYETILWSDTLTLGLFGCAALIAFAQSYRLALAEPADGELS